MITQLRGVVVSVDFSEVVINVGGVGYAVNMPIQDVSTIPVGKEIIVHICEVIREQSFDLYGFLDKRTKNLFNTLLKVNGVGPRTALALIGIGDVERLSHAVTAGESAYFVQAPGVGPKLAQRLCLELKGKISVEFSSDETNGSNVTPGIALDVTAALEALGFKQSDITRMVKSVDTTLSIEEQIKAALKER